ncbi:prephenate/arogenate dehydrogenase family protein [Yunchengibacter salinarum]|uniref:prephenate/arogenate dehydrogenase family protein n=1 Tax=Yunchengibacter salinarum TaxID=3133399 RepID=UPI0035B60AB5
MSTPPITRVALVGAGLIGSSMALATRAYVADGTVTLTDHDPDTLAAAERLGLADRIMADPAAAVAGADLVVLAVPVGAMAAAAKAIAPGLTAGQIVTDAGSVKASVLADVAPHLPPGVAFIPGHPVAGTEQSGPAAGFPALFRDRWCILTPPQTMTADDPALARLTAYWQALGARVEVMDAHHHDLVLAITSHVPHLIAYNIVGTASDLADVTEREVISYSAGGFRDFTRIAASDPVMWRDVFLKNKDAVLEMLGRFNEDLMALQRAIRWDDGDALLELFTRTRAIRRGIVEAGQDAGEADFGRHRGDDVRDDDPAL